MIRTKAYFFISSELSEEDSCPLVFTDEAGHAIEPAQPCRIDELSQTINDCLLIIVIPDQLTALHRVTLPLLSNKKAQAAIPYALEDYSAQEVTELHFAYDRKFYKNGQYLVVSCDKAWLQNLVALLQKHRIEPEQMTTAWFALSDNECVVYKQCMLCHSPTLNGAMPLAMWPMIKDQFSSLEGITVMQFHKEAGIPKELNGIVTSSQKTWESWVTERLNQSMSISLNQGSFAPKKEQTSLAKSLWLIGGSVSVWLILWLTTSLLSVHRINQEIKQVDDGIAVIYRQFFPGTKKVISPRFRISQKLKSHGASDEPELWRLLDRLAAPLNINHMTLVQLSYQNQHIILTLTANDFSQLEKFMTDLKTHSVKATQLNANRNENKVEAAVEIQL